MVPSYERTRETECPALAAIVPCTTEFAPNIASLIRFSQIVDMDKFYSLLLDLVAESGSDRCWDLDGVTDVFDAVGRAGVVEIVGVI